MGVCEIPFSGCPCLLLVAETTGPADPWCLFPAWPCFCSSPIREVLSVPSCSSLYHRFAGCRAECSHPGVRHVVRRARGHLQRVPPREHDHYAWCGRWRLHRHGGGSQCVTQRRHAAYHRICGSESSDRSPAVSGCPSDDRRPRWPRAESGVVDRETPSHCRSPTLNSPAATSPH